MTSDTTAETEATLLANARRYSFRARMDKGDPAGPVFVAGSGSEVEDVTGRRYLDLNSGQMCAALGHNHPTVTAAIKEACDTLIHAHSSYYNVQEIRLAGRLAGVMPAGLEKSLFLQSGSEANEAAVMIARQFTGGYEVASPHVSFHVRYGALPDLFGLACRTWRAARRELRVDRALLLPLSAAPTFPSLQLCLPRCEL
jgi:2,2-dialkylglycine decarboxylase (pyruvate)